MDLIPKLSSPQVQIFLDQVQSQDNVQQKLTQIQLNYYKPVCSRGNSIKQQIVTCTDFQCSDAVG